MIKTYRIYIRTFNDGTHAGYLVCPGVPPLKDYKLYGTFDTIEQAQDAIDKQESPAIFHVIGIMAHTCSQAYRHQLEKSKSRLRANGVDHSVEDLNG